MFATNVGTLDRTLRIALGLAVLSLFLVYPETEWRYLALLGFIPLITGLAGKCPLYALLGVSTCEKQRS